MAPDPRLMYGITAVAVAGLAAWVVRVLATVKTPWVDATARITSDAVAESVAAKAVSSAPPKEDAPDAGEDATGDRKKS